jgi:3-phosphoshikimate 1-carboxyvinyltransferase
MTIIKQPGLARDHSIRLLQAMGVDVRTREATIELISEAVSLRPVSFTVAGDMSSAAYWIVAATVIPDSHIRLLGVGVNPTRTGIVTALIAMGADISLSNERLEGGEPVADITVTSAELRGVTIENPVSLNMIDDFPAFTIAALHASGRTVVSDAQELRTKDSDRIAAMIRQLAKMGAHIVERSDGFELEGPQNLHGAVVSSENDHRIALSLGIAALLARGVTTIAQHEDVTESYPEFLINLQQFGVDISVEDDVVQGASS